MLPGSPLGPSPCIRRVRGRQRGTRILVRKGPVVCQSDVGLVIEAGDRVHEWPNSRVQGRRTRLHKYRVTFMLWCS